MKDLAKTLVTAISRLSPCGLSRTAWAVAVATVAAGGLLLTASANVPVSRVPDNVREPSVRLYGLSESVSVGQILTAPQDVSLGQVVAVLVRPDQRQGLSLRESLLDVVTTFGGSTLGYANGRIPAEVLCPLEFAPGHMLRCDAAERLTALSDEFEREFGRPIPITDSYRSYVLQVAVASTKPHLAAIPGTSNHGWGLAVDLGDPIAGGACKEYVWLRVHGAEYGWDNPSWARLGGAKPEPWHFEFFAAGSVPNRAINPSDVGTWGSTDPSDSSDGASPRHKPALDPKPKDGSSADGVRKPPTQPKPSDPTPKPTTPTTRPTPSPSPSPSEPGQEPSASPSPSPSPSPSEPGREPSASPSPSPAWPSPSSTSTPTPSGDGEAPYAPTRSPSPSASSGPLSRLAKGLGLVIDDAEN